MDNSNIGVFNPTVMWKSIRWVGLVKKVMFDRFESLEKCTCAAQRHPSRCGAGERGHGRGEDSEYVTTETIKVVKVDPFVKGKGVEIVGGIRRNFATIYI